MRSKEAKETKGLDRPDLTLLRQTVRRSSDLADRIKLWDTFAETSAFKNVAEVHVARATFLADAFGDDERASAAFKKAFAKIDALTSASGVASTKRTSCVSSASLESPGALVLCRAWMAFERSRSYRDRTNPRIPSLARSFLDGRARRREAARRRGGARGSRREGGGPRGGQAPAPSQRPQLRGEGHQGH